MMDVIFVYTALSVSSTFVDSSSSFGNETVKVR